MSAADIDPTETREWIDALDAVLRHDNPERARFLLEQLSDHASQKGVPLAPLTTPYVNTIPVADEELLPEDDGIARRLRAIIRWNAAAMVVNAGKFAPELGGHIATYASIATLYEVGFNHFFHSYTADNGGDLVFFQGHSSPGIYARSFLEGRFDETRLSRFRQEIGAPGLSSYPHPWLMPEYWQFATVSMGLGPLQAIYQARFLKYLENREIIPKNDRHVWCFCGDGEMDEPESMGALTLAGRENLDNLIFVINCNLQGLDGPVRGNGKIIQEFEGAFRGAGWNVIKVLWGRHWDPLLARDKSGLLKQRMMEAVDGEYQNYRAHDGAYVREHFFGKYPELQEMVAGMSDEEIWRLNRGGLDAQKVYAAYTRAVKHMGQPTVILAKTVKGFGMGSDAGEGKNVTHSQKKMTEEQLVQFRNRFNIPIDDAHAKKAKFYYPGDKSPEVEFLKKRRESLGGEFPKRRTRASVSLPTPALSAFEPLLKGSADKEMSTTMAFVRMLNVLVKDKAIGSRIVPIVPDESRTFGMEGLFRQLGIYSPHGQRYTPVDADQVMYYREDEKGQYIEEGITEAGAFCAWMAAATSYSNHDQIMIPFYIYYSMFGYQRIGDLVWAAGDMQARGFLMGATAGRTTLAGEGLQHQDGHNHLMFAMVPNCRCYDPTFSYELAVIVQDGLHRMVQNQENIFYYLSVMNENYTHPPMPAGVEEGILRGMYLFKEAKKPQIQLLGSGTILREVIRAAELLEKDFQIEADIWSVTSFSELRREAQNIERHNALSLGSPNVPYVTQCLKGRAGPVLAATDYIRLYGDQLRAYIPETYVVLGTDGYGRSDTRERLRHFFEVNAEFIAFTAIRTLHDRKVLGPDVVKKAMELYGINPEKPDPVSV